MDMGLLLTFSIFCFHLGHAQKATDLPNTVLDTHSSALNLVGYLGACLKQTFGSLQPAPRPKQSCFPTETYLHHHLQDFRSLDTQFPLDERRSCDELFAYNDLP